MRVRACGVCRTDLHILDEELSDPSYPITPGHQVVAEVLEVGDGVTAFMPGDRVGVPWLGWSCGECEHCRNGEENLCERAEFTGYDRPGGFADEMVADARYAFPIPEGLQDIQAAPLLCGGLIGYRAYRIALATAGRVERLGLYGFGAAAHILAQVALHEDREVFAFTRPGDDEGQRFARSLGAAWAGGSDASPPAPLDAAILFAPVGALVPAALAAVRSGGAVVCGGIHMSDIPSFPYRLLWGERVLRSVANLTRRDAEEFLPLAAAVPVRTHVTTYPLEEACRALDDLRHGSFEGAAVLDVDAGRDARHAEGEPS